MEWYLWILLIAHFIGIIFWFIATHIVMVNKDYKYNRTTKIQVFGIFIFWELFLIYLYCKKIIKRRKNKMIERGF